VASDFGSGAYTSSKGELRASRVDFEEALKVLNNTSSDYEEENKEIERLKVFAETGIYRVDCSENIINGMEHLEKAVAYTESEDFNLTKKELDKTNEALNNTTIYMSLAKEKFSFINPDSVPVEQKSYVTEIKGDLENSEKVMSELKEMINGMYPYIDGCEHLFKAVEYMETEKWGIAADEFANSSVKFSESKKSLDKLKNSEYSEISVNVIKISGFLKKAEENLPHIEAGCRYADQGRYSQAEEEFKKVSDFK
jgi:tetratricopeptide (TPR) repeat protein